MMSPRSEASTKASRPLPQPSTSRTSIAAEPSAASAEQRFAAYGDAAGERKHTHCVEPSGHSLRSAHAPPLKPNLGYLYGAITGGHHSTGVLGWPEARLDSDDMCAAQARQFVRRATLEAPSRSNKRDRDLHTIDFCARARAVAAQSRRHPSTEHPMSIEVPVGRTSGTQGKLPPLFVRWSPNPSRHSSPFGKKSADSGPRSICAAV